MESKWRQRISTGLDESVVSHRGFSRNPIATVCCAMTPFQANVKQCRSLHQPNAVGVSRQKHRSLANGLRFFHTGEELGARPKNSNDLLVQVAERILCPTLKGMSVLGELKLLAHSTIDVPLERTEKPYKYIKYPNSFRASLEQIINAAYRAFDKAHINMDKIRSYSMSIPDHMREITDILVSKDHNQISRYLKIPLNKIDDTSKECLKLSKNAEEAFKSVESIIHEVVESCTSTNGTSERNRKRDQQLLDIKKKSQERYETRLNDLKKKERKLDEEADDALSALKKIIDSSPGIFGLAFLSLAERLPDILIAARAPPGILLARSFVASSQGGVGIPHVSYDQVNQLAAQEEEKRRKQLAKFKSVVAGLKPVVSQLVKLASDGFKNLDDSEASEESFNADECILAVNNMKRRAREFYELQTFIDDLLSFLEKKVRFAKQRNMSEANVDQLTSEIKNLDKTFDRIQAEAPQSQSPNIYVTQRVGETGVTGVVRAKQEMHQNNLDTAKKRWLVSREDVARVWEQKLEDESQYLKLREKTQELDYSVVRYDEVIKLLIKGLKALQTFKEDWDGIAKFFQYISAGIDDIMRNELDSFTAYVRAASSDDKLAKDTRERIYNFAVTAEKNFFVLQSVTNVYVKFSDIYVMGNLNKLGRLTGIDPARAHGMINELKETCNTDCEVITQHMWEESIKLTKKWKERSQELKEVYTSLRTDKAARGMRNFQFLIDHIHRPNTQRFFFILFVILAFLLGLYFKRP